MEARDDFIYDFNINVRQQDYWEQRGEAFVNAVDDAAQAGDADSKPIDRYYRNKTLEHA